VRHRPAPGGKTIRVELASNEPLHARVSKSQLEQIVMNVAANARDAVPGGGTFALRARRRDVATGKVSDLDASVFAEIAASDTGTGIAFDVTHGREMVVSRLEEARAQLAAGEDFELVAPNTVMCPSPSRIRELSATSIWPTSVPSPGKRSNL
jgi:hypothetical protein